jgi:putative endonuclease
VYILASKPNGTLYVGVTSDLIRRVWEHKTGEIDGFTKNYGVKTLVYFEMHAEMPDAIVREKQIKKWRRAWKLDLIRRGNSTWRDLYDEIAGSETPAGFPLSRE